MRLRVLQLAIAFLMMEGCAAKKQADDQARFAIPLSCVSEIQAKETLCRPTEKPDEYDCNHVRVKAGCVRVKKQL